MEEIIKILKQTIDDQKMIINELKETIDLLKKDKNDDSMEFKKYCEEIFLPNKKVSLKETSYFNYKSRLELYIYNNLKGLKLHEIDNNIIQKLINENSKMSRRSLIELRSLVATILNFAIRRGDLKTKNNFFTEYPKENKQEDKKNVATPEDIKLLQSFSITKIIENDKMKYKYLGVLVMMYTGIRIAEACFLRFKHFDLEKNILKIEGNRSTIYDSDIKEIKTIETTPKTNKSKRTIPINNDLKKILLLFQNNKKDDYILTGNINGYETRSFRSFFERLLKKLNIEHISPHKLRHTFITTLIENKNDVKQVAEIVGHTDVSVTLNTYYHPSIETLKNAVTDIYKNTEERK